MIESTSRTSTPVCANVSNDIISPPVSPINSDASYDEMPMYDIPLETLTAASVSPSFKKMNIVQTPTQSTRNKDHRSTLNKVFPVLLPSEFSQTSSTN